MRNKMSPIEHLEVKPQSMGWKCTGSNQRQKERLRNVKTWPWKPCKTKHRVKKESSGNEQSISELWDSFRKPDICDIEGPEEDYGGGYLKK